MLNPSSEPNDIPRGLRALPPARAPRGSWREIRTRAERDGLLSPRRRRRGYPSRRLLSFGLAATVLLAVIGLEPEPDPAAPVFSATPAADLVAVEALVRQSMLLEEALRLSPAPPRIVRAGVASRRTAAEDRIAAIDQTLLLHSSDFSSSELAELWGERGSLMNTLVDLRYSQAQRIDF